MTQIPDPDELARRIDKTDHLVDELFRVLNTVLEWKNKLTGGMSVMIWVVGITQTIVLTLLGIAANSLNTTAETMGKHAVELAAAKTELSHIISQPRYSPSEAAADHAELRAWVTEKLNQRAQ